MDIFYSGPVPGCQAGENPLLNINERRVNWAASSTCDQVSECTTERRGEASLQQTQTTRTILVNFPLTDHKTSEVCKWFDIIYHFYWYGLPHILIFLLPRVAFENKSGKSWLNIEDDKVSSLEYCNAFDVLDGKVCGNLAHLACSICRHIDSTWN